MTFWLTADDIQHALEHVRQEEMPAVIARTLSRMLTGERLNNLDMIFDKIPPEQGSDILCIIFDKIPPEERLDYLGIIFDKMSPEKRLSSLDKIKDFIPKEQLKEWARKILDESE